ncbi:alpha/beta hydrolase family protein [Clostridium beijerinckii]|uniref:alpha/beta hydrolase family protein n=1 Tax=Clostridium beijerinckii TaxID=1520 RepID=UPI00047B3C8B|nr:acetylhydrolase [Clostridium beijerinckii]
MGIIVVSIAAVIEIVFGIYCFKTKSNQKKIRSLIHISVFIAFVVFTFLSVIQWSFRWMLLGGVLLIFAITSVISLILKREDKKKYKIRKMVGKSIAMCIVVVLAVSPELIFPQHKMPELTGKYKEIKTATYTFKDNNRIDIYSPKGENREVTVEFWYPEDDEVTSHYPLVVFSHGAYGMKTSNMSTFRELASNGYVVCSIDHPYQCLFTRDADGKITTIDKSFMDELNGANNGAYDEETEYNLGVKWLNVRTEDMNFVLDTIIKNVKEGNTEKVYSLIDAGKIGLIGHSLGASASAQLGRERSDVSAVVNLDDDLIGEYTGFNNGKLQINHNIYPIPILSIYSDDLKRIYEKTDPSIIPQKLISATALKSFEVYFDGTNHMSFTDLPLASPILTKLLCNTANSKIGIQKADKYYVIEKMNNLVLQFFNCYLKNEGDFRPEDKY